MKDYNPAKKPNIYRCSKCNSYICITHSLNSYICFCMCRPCGMRTYNDERLKLKICLKCKQKRCLNCKDAKCTCRCDMCFELNGASSLQQHRCEFDKECHECLNTFKNMVKCSCGKFMCRNCALPRLESTQDGKYYYRCPK
jgi:hypothetical protein